MFRLKRLFVGHVFTIIGLVLVLFQVACSADLSRDGRYKATLVRQGGSAHYHVQEIETDRLVLVTRAQYDTPNDAKAGGFSSDSAKFAAAYHYGHDGGYTWIGVWSTQDGEFLYFKVKPGYTTSLFGVFDE